MELITNAQFIIDTSSMLTQKENELYRRTVLKSQWSKLDEMVKSGIVVTCSEIAEEVHDDIVKKWMEECEMVVLPINEEVQYYVREIVTKVNTHLVDFKGNKSSGDVFLIATAKAYGLSVITQEKKNSTIKIPYTCEKMDIPCYNIIEFFDEMGFIY